MLKLASVFSDNALYLHTAPLTVRGFTEPERNIKLTLFNNTKETDILSLTEVSDGEGKFSFTFTTPEASFDSYSLRVDAEDESITAENILFGELWIASGQSNMELPNSWLPEYSEMREWLLGKPIRVYNINNRAADAEYFRQPLEDYAGKWAATDGDGLWDAVSALATGFCRALYNHFLGEGKNVPVGFVNANRGAANVESWIPEREMLKSSRRCKYLKSIDLFPTDDSYNKLGGRNYLQVGSYYNFKIHPTLGVRYRGILWHQGESNVGTHNEHGNYSELLKLLRDSLKPNLAPSEDAPFPLIASQLYPWAFSSCTLNYLNLSIASLAESDSEHFSYAPVCDLRSNWSFWTNNHPIHPLHKYELGERFAALAVNMLYRRRRGAMTMPAVLKNWYVDGNKIILKFKGVGTGLYIKGKEARGIYIRSEGSVYTKAYARVIDKSTLEVSHPFIEKPCHVAYAMSSFEHDVNLFAGELPLAPFSTEVDYKSGTPKIDIKVKNWLYPELDGEQFILEADKNVFKRQIWHPSSDSEVCYDSEYALSPRSLRIRGSADGFGAYVLSHKCRELDLENYSALRLCVLNSKGLSLTARLYYEEGSIVELGESIESIIHSQGSLQGKAEDKAVSVKLSNDKILGEAQRSYRILELEAERLGELGGGWSLMSVDFSHIPKGNIQKLELYIKISEENHLRTTACIDKLLLIPKQ